ncbi:MAG: hypothetical protein A2Y25_07610 [Candidatus Melainabacteria bacterium GWF2_37_15]|nr:MAG: hypothetical protein A2Y25_07610 [Candidatus Melainabacteria bacterium GWF2_37_15]
MKLKTIQMSQIGEVNFRKSKRNKKINITVKPPGIVRVSLPERGDFKHAEKFVQSNIDWILENIERVKNIKKPKEIIDEKTNYKTRHHTLYFQTHKAKKVQCKLHEGNIMVCYPETASIHEDHIQKAVRKSIDSALKLEAEKYLLERAEFLAQKRGFKYKSLSLFNSKRYWGMCMNDNSIKLNIHLMRLPDELIDYVILHEFAHIKEKNHSPKFYEVLGTLVPEPKVLYQQMKKYYPTRYN